MAGAGASRVTIILLLVLCLVSSMFSYNSTLSCPNPNKKNMGSLLSDSMIEKFDNFFQITVDEKTTNKANSMNLTPLHHDLPNS